MNDQRSPIFIGGEIHSIYVDIQKKGLNTLDSLTINPSAVCVAQGCIRWQPAAADAVVPLL